MKRVFSILLLMAVLASVAFAEMRCAAAAPEPNEKWAEEHEWTKQNDRYIKYVEGIRYELWCGKNAFDKVEENDYNWQIITGKSENLSGVVVIPGEIDGFAVTTIGGETFRGNSELTECVLSEGTVLISAGAFENCLNLRNIFLPQTLRMVDAESFYNCPKLNELTIPKGVEYIVNGAFCGDVSGEEGLEKITFEGDAPKILSVGDSESVTLSGIDGVELYVYENTRGWDQDEWKPLEIYYIKNEVLPTGSPEPTVTLEPTNTPEITLAPPITATPIPEVAETPIPTVTGTPIPTVTGTPIPEITEMPIPTITETPAPEESLPEGSVELIFDDVYKDWYTNDLQAIYDLGIMTGIKGTKKFMPQAELTRAQAVQAVYRMAGSPEFINNYRVFENLKDVYAEEWYAEALAWAYQNKIVTGDLNTYRFYPNRGISREHLALILYRYSLYNMEEENKDLIRRNQGDFVLKKSGISDLEKTSPWAKEAVEWAFYNGILKGMDKTEGDENGIQVMLQPLQKATRAQASVLFRRYMEWTEQLEKIIE